MRRFQKLRDPHAAAVVKFRTDDLDSDWKSVRREAGGDNGGRKVGRGGKPDPELRVRGWAPLSIDHIGLIFLRDIADVRIGRGRRHRGDQSVKIGEERAP